MFFLLNRVTANLLSTSERSVSRKGLSEPKLPSLRTVFIMRIRSNQKKFYLEFREEVIRRHVCR